MAYEPSSLTVENRDIKAIFIKGKIGSDFPNLDAVHRRAKDVARNIFHPCPDQRDIIILETLYSRKFDGYYILVTLSNGGFSRVKKWQNIVAEEVAGHVS